MADIATVFAWGPADMDPMGVVDLMGWHALAIERAKARAGIKD